MARGRGGTVRTLMQEADEEAAAGVSNELRPGAFGEAALMAVPATPMDALEPEEEQAATGGEAAASNVTTLYAQHLENLAARMGDEQRRSLAAALIDEIRSAEQSRKPFHQQMIRGIRSLGFDRSRDKRNVPFPGSSAVIHPAFAQACVDMHARTSSQLAPPSGPAKTVVLGNQSVDETDRADRVARHLNWQCTSQMREWSSEHDRLLMMVGPEGSSFKKVWYDPTLHRPRTAYIPSENICMPYSAANHMTSPLVAERMDKLRHEVDDLIASKHWLPHAIGEPQREAPTEVRAARDQVIGLFDDGHYQPRYDPYRYWECQVTRAIPGVDEGRTGEYLITVADAAQIVVAIRRHWRKTDKLRERRGMLQHYKLFPWEGPYGLGLYHLIGGLGHAATGALRALLDSAHWTNMPGGFRLPSSRGSGAIVTRAPGQYPEISVPGVRDIRQAIMADPHPGPSTVLFQLLEFLTSSSEKFASIALQETSESNQNVPVGTTLARVDEGSRVYSGVFARLHQSEGMELQEIYAIDCETVLDQMQFYEFVDPEIEVNDFRKGISIEPVSDPQCYSQLQRALTAQTRLDLAERATERGIEVDLRAAFEAAAKAMQLPGADTLFPDPKEPFAGDPFTENAQAFEGVPLQAAPDQPHEEHMRVHLAALMLPGAITTPPGKALFKNYMDHASLGALWIAAARHQQQELGVDQGSIDGMLPDPGAWYEQHMQALEPALQPLADPATQAVAQVEQAKTDADRERVHIETAAKLELARADNQYKLTQLQTLHVQKMQEIAAQQGNKLADNSTKLAMGDRANASRERVEAMWGGIDQQNAASDRATKLEAERMKAKARKVPARRGK